MAVTINGTNGVTFNNGSTQAIGSGMGTGASAQTWQNVSGSRAFATTYTNSTGYPIMVSVSNQAGSQLTASISFSINGTVIANQGPNSGTAGSMWANIIAIVPAGATYSANLLNVSSSYVWWELR